MLQFILGASGTGKTMLVHEMIEKLASNKNRSKKIMLILPEQFTFEMEKMLFEKLGAEKLSYVKVTSFTRLATEVFKAFGGIAGDYASDAAKTILMELAIESVKSELKVYQKTAGSKTFTSTMQNAIAELKHAGVSPHELNSTVAKLGEDYLADKTGDIALLYAQYQTMLETTYLDSLDDIIRATKILEKSETNFFDNYQVFFDEFKSFTANENGLIKMIFKQAAEVHVSLCIDCTRADYEDMAISPFASVKETYQKLMRFCREVDVKVASPIKLMEQHRLKTASLRHMEQNLFSCNIKPFDMKNEIVSDSIGLMLCKNEYDEVDTALSLIAELVQEKGYKYRDIAIISRDLQTYISKLTVAFSRYNIPYFADIRTGIMAKPLIRFVQSLLRCVVNRFQSDDMIGLLKSGLTKFSVEEISELENYIYIWDIKGKQWHSEFTYNPRGFKEGFSNADTETLERINNLREFISTRLLKFDASVKDVTGEEICKATLELIKSFEVKETMQTLIENFYLKDETVIADEYTRIWKILMELLDILAITINRNKITLKRFEQLYTSIGNSYDMGNLPQSLDCVIVGSADRIRVTDKKAVIVLGVNENILPFVPDGGGIFTDKERERLIALDVSITPPSKKNILEERFIAYKTLCSATDMLFLTARKANVSGKSMMESSLFYQLKKMFSAEIVKESDDISGEFYCKSKITAFSYLAKSFNNDDELTESLKFVLSKDDEYRKRIEVIESISSKKEFEITDKANAKILFGTEMNISPTRIEGFYKCRFRYFCEHGLRIYPLKRAALDPMETGTLIHSIIYSITTRTDLKKDYDEQSIKKQIRSELNLYIEQVMGGVKDKTKRFLYLYNRMSLSIFKVIDRLHNELLQSKFEPVDYEFEIGNQSEVTPLVLENDDGTKISVSGKIDRIDIYINSKGDRYVRIIDYKSGKKIFKLNDVLYGLNLQMLIYLFCIQNNGNGKYQNCLPAGILYMPAGETAPSLQRDADANEQEKFVNEAYRMNGLLLMDEDSLEAMESGHDGIFIPISTKSDGNFTKQTLDSLVTLKELGKINNYINKLIVNMATELHAGKIQTDPIDNACEYCNYKSVCAKKDNENERDYIKYDREELLKKMNNLQDENSKEVE